jgi:hypothetical protein
VTIPGAGSTVVTTVQAGGVATTIITVTYTTVCPTDRNQLTVTETCITMPYIPCARCPNRGVPAVPMATITEQCNHCGRHGEDVVTLTCPQAVVSPSPAAPTGPSPYAPGSGSGSGSGGQNQNPGGGAQSQPGAQGVTPPAPTAVPTAPVISNPPIVVTAGGAKNTALWSILAAVTGVWALLAML